MRLHCINDKNWEAAMRRRDNPEIHPRRPIRAGRTQHRPRPDERAEIHPARGPRLRRSRVDHRRHHPQLLARGARHALRPRREVPAAAADGRRPRHQQRQAAMGPDPARRAEVP